MSWQFWLWFCHWWIEGEAAAVGVVNPVLLCESGRQGSWFWLYVFDGVGLFGRGYVLFYVVVCVVAVCVIGFVSVCVWLRVRLCCNRVCVCVCLCCVWLWLCAVFGWFKGLVCLLFFRIRLWIPLWKCVQTVFYSDKLWLGFVTFPQEFWRFRSGRIGLRWKNCVVGMKEQNAWQTAIPDSDMHKFGLKNKE